MDYIGMKVIKRSGKPFKSGLKINTVKGIVPHPNIPAAAFTFEEDDSKVWIGACREVNQRDKKEC